MSKLRKSILIIGILVIVVAASLATALALYATGSIKTDPVQLEFRLKEQRKVYDGTPLKLSRVDFDYPEDSDIALVKGELASGHKINVEFTGSQTNVGTSVSDATVKIYDENGFNVTSDYAIKVEGAELTVTQKSISVELPSQEVVYNGAKVLFGEYRVTENENGELADLCKGHRIYGSTDAELLNVGDTLPDDLTPLIYDVVGNDVTENYNIEFKKGEIKVVPRPITVRPVSYEKVYDGEEIVADKIEFVEGSLVEGQSLKVVINDGYTNALTDVDEIETRITSLQILDNIGGEEVDVTKNYEFNLQEYTGVLKVTPRPLTVTAKSASFVYNGEEQSLKGDTEPLSVEGLAGGDELFSVSYVSSLKNVGAVANKIGEVVLKGSTDNYDITVIDGEIEVTPYELTFRTGSAEKYYDGEALTSGQSYYTLANEEKHKIVISGNGELPAITNVGEKANAYKITVVDKTEGDEDCTANYAVKYDYGTLTVKRLPVTVTLKNGATDREKVYYDGGAHTPTLGGAGGNSQYFDVAPALNDNEEVEKFTLTYADFEVVSSARTMCVTDEYDYTVKFKDGTAEERKLYSNYELFVPANGVLEIVPLPVKVTLKEYSEGVSPFVYSGKAVKLDVTDAITAIALNGITLDGVAVADLITAADFTVVADEIVDAGTDYTYNVKITDGAKAKNFDVAAKDTALTVKPMPVTVTLKDVEHTYNGEVQTVAVDETILSIKRTEPVAADEDINEVAGLTKNDLLVRYRSGDRKKAANHTFVVAPEKKKAQNNYDIKLVSVEDDSRNYALLKINPFELEVTTDTQEFVYNGKNRSSGAFENGELANANHIIVLATAANSLPTVCTVADTAVNAFDVAVYDGVKTPENDVTANYNIIYVNGKLSVKPRVITVQTATPAAHTYDGKAFSSSTATITEGLSDGKEDLTGEFKAQLARGKAPFAITDVGRERNVFDCAIVNKYGVEVTANFEISRFDYGWLEVVPRAITLRTGSGLKVYDGTPLFNTDIDIIESDLSSAYTARPSGETPFSITNAGSVENKYECSILTKAGADVTGNFTVEFDDDCGTLTVEPLTITFTLDDFAESDTVDMVYDGKPKKFEVADAVVRITDADGGIYFITEKAEGAVGLQFTEDDFEIEYSSLVLDVGSYMYTVKFTDETFAGNFKIESAAEGKNPTSAIVRVKKMPVSISLNAFNGDNALTYNSRVQTLDVTDAVAEISGENGKDVTGIISVDDLTVVYPEELLNAGDYIYKVKIADDVFEKNFAYVQPEAAVTVKKFRVTVSLSDCFGTYSGGAYAFDGTEAYVNDELLFEDEVTGETVFVSEKLSSADFACAAKGGGEIKDVGTYDYIAAFADDVNANNYEILFANQASVKIEPLGVDVALKPVALTFNGEEQKLDGALALECSSDLALENAFVFTVSIDGGETILYNAGRYDYSATLVSDNFYLNRGGNTVGGGVVTVGKYAVTVTLDELTKVYDGEEYRADPSDILSVSGDLFTAGHFTIEYDDGTAEGAAPDRSGAGDHKIKAAFAKKYKEYEGNVDITTVNDKITISQRTVTLTTQTKSFIYNGEAQSAPEAELTGAVTGHYAVAVEGAVATVKNVADGAVANKSAYKIYRKGLGGEVDVTANYVIDEEHSSYGTLKVDKLAVTVKTGSARREYDGTELSCKALEPVEGLLATHKAVLSDTEIYQSITEIGSVKNTFGGVTIVDGGGNDVTENYLPEYEYGTLEVIQIEVKVTLKSDIKVTYKGGDFTPDEIETIESIERTLTPDGALALSADDFTLAFTETVVRNAGEYGFTLSLDDAHYKVEYAGEQKFTVGKRKLEVTLKNYTGEQASEYTGAEQELPTAGITLEGAPDEIAKSDFEFVCDEKLLNAGTYKYGVALKDETKAGNYELSVNGGAADAKSDFEIVPAELTVTLADFEKIYSGKAYTVDVIQAVLSIKDSQGNDSALLDKDDFKVKYNQELRLVNHYLEVLGDGEIYEGRIEPVNGVNYKVLTDDVYTYSVEVADKEMSKNVTLTVTGGTFKINKRKITFTLDNVYISSQDYKSYGYANRTEFEVTDKVSISSHTPLGEGDELTIVKAVAEREDFDSNTLYLMAIDEFVLTNAGCYEFTNATAAQPVAAQLIIY